VPAAFTPGAPAAHDLDIVLSESGVRIKAQGGAATVGLRRFADEFQPLGRVAADTAATLRIGPDNAGRPWHVQVAPTARAVVCSIG
jgi:hypothetical protein